MAALWETVLAVAILFWVMAAGLGVELARKLGKHLHPLRYLRRACKRRHPHACDAVLKFAEIWDSFTTSSLDFEDRFAIFCDELGDFLEALVQRAVDWLEWLFQVDAAEQSAALCRVPRQRLTPEDCKAGVGRLAVTSCAICISDWEPGDDCRTLPGCQHTFHCSCVDQWLYRREACPLCRKPVAV